MFSNFCTDDTRSLQLEGNPLQTTNNMCLFVKWEEIAAKIGQNERQMKAKTILFPTPFRQQNHQGHQQQLHQIV